MFNVIEGDSLLFIEIQILSLLTYVNRDTFID